MLLHSVLALLIRLYLLTELVIEKEDTSDDEKLPEIIPIPREEPKAKGENPWAIHEKDLKVRPRLFTLTLKCKRLYF